MTPLIRQNALKIIFTTLILLPLAIYWQTSNFSFVWDDQPLYINAKHFPAEGRTNNLDKFWSPNGKDMYAPVTYTFWAFAASLGDSTSDKSVINPKPFHVLNILVHIINCLLVFIILFKLLKNHWFAWFGALLFAIHPVQAEAVAWVSELRGLLSAMFGFIAIARFISFRQGPIPVPTQSAKKDSKNKPDKKKATTSQKVKPVNPFFAYSIIIIALVLSMLSKPSGIVFPLIIIVLDAFQFRTKGNKLLLFGLALLILIVPFAWLTKSGESVFAVNLEVPVLQRFIIYADSIIFYLYKALLPFSSSACYGRTPQYVLGSSFAWISPLLLAGILVALYFLNRKFKGFVVPFLIFILAILPVSGLLSFNFQYWSSVADRYMYVSLFAFAWIFAESLRYFKKEKQYWLFSIAVILIFSYFTLMQLPAWKSEISLWSNAIENSPESSGHPYNARGNIYLEAKQYLEALDDLNKAAELTPGESSVFYNRGNVYLDLEKYEPAIADFSKAISLRKNNPDYYVNRALCFDAIQKLPEAINDMTTAIKIDPMQSALYSERGVYLAKSGDLMSAEKDFRKALELNPKDSEASDNLKMLFQK